MKTTRNLMYLALLTWTAVGAAGTNTFTPVGPSGGSTYGVEFVGGGGLVTVTLRGVYRSTDNGANWARVATTGFSTVQAVAVNPTNRNQVLIGSSTLLRSIDAGVTWTQVPNLPRLSTNTVMSLKFTANGAVAYMSTANGSNLFRSTDGGTSWVEIPSTLTAGITSIEVDAMDPQLLYVQTTEGGHRSTDGGATFTKFSFAPYVRGIAASRGTAGMVLARSDVQNSRPWLSTNGGLVWTQLVDGDIVDWTGFGLMPGGSFARPAFDPANANRMALASYGGLLISNDGGTTWLERNSGLQEGNARHLVVSRAGAGVIYLVMADLASVYRRDSSSGAWNAVGAAGTAAVVPLASSYYDAYSLAPSAQDANLLYLARNERIERSLDGGLHWTTRSTLFAQTLVVSPHDSQSLYAGSWFRVPMRSADGGATWMSLAAAGLPEGAMYFTFDPTNANVVYAGVSNYAVSVTHPVYKSVDGGATFAPTGWNPVGNPGTYGRLVHHPARANVLYFGTQRGVYKTTDGGATWVRSASFDTLPLSYDFGTLLVDPQSPEIVYTGGYYRAIIARSVNGGTSWDLIGSTEEFKPFNDIALVPGTRTKIIGSRIDGSGEMDLVGDLRLTSADTSVVQGRLASTTFAVTNRSAFALSDVRVTATLPASSTTYTTSAAAGTCAVNGQALSCEIGALAAQGSVNVSVGYTPSAVDPWSVSAAAYEPEATAADNTVTIAISAAPAGGGTGGGSRGGGALDYLLLAALALLAMVAARSRGRASTPANPFPVPLR